MYGNVRLQAISSIVKRFQAQENTTVISDKSTDEEKSVHENSDRNISSRAREPVVDKQQAKTSDQTEQKLSSSTKSPTKFEKKAKAKEQSKPPKASNQTTLSSLDDAHRIDAVLRRILYVARFNDTIKVIDAQSAHRLTLPQNATLLTGDDVGAAIAVAFPDVDSLIDEDSTMTASLFDTSQDDEQSQITARVRVLSRMASAIMRAKQVVASFDQEDDVAQSVADTCSSLLLSMILPNKL